MGAHDSEEPKSRPRDLPSGLTVGVLEWVLSEVRMRGATSSTRVWLSRSSEGNSVSPAWSFAFEPVRDTHEMSPGSEKLCADGGNVVVLWPLD